MGATWWILMSRRFRICMAKGGRESARPSYGRPKLTLISREKNHLRRCSKKPPAAIFTLEPNHPERIFLYIKKSSQEDFALKSKLWPPKFLEHRRRWFFSLEIRVNFGRPQLGLTDSLPPLAIRILNRLDTIEWSVFLGLFRWFLRSVARFTFSKFECFHQFFGRKSHCMP